MDIHAYTNTTGGSQADDPATARGGPPQVEDYATAEREANHGNRHRDERSPSLDLESVLSVSTRHRSVDHPGLSGIGRTADYGGTFESHPSLPELVYRTHPAVV